MTTLKYILKPALIVLIGFGIAGCEKKGSLESAGQAADSKINKASEAIKDESQKVGEAIKDESHKVAVYVDDAAVTAKVNAAILAESGMSVFNISVETTKGVTALTGTIDSNENRNKAERLVAGVEGVKRVDNRLRIQ